LQNDLQNDLFSKEEKYDFASGDISESYLKRARAAKIISCDLETSGLDWKSQRIGLVQLFSASTGVVVFKPVQKKTPRRFVRLIQDPNVQKIFHHAMFDLRFISYHWKASPKNIRCTKIASKILDPERKDHSLLALLKAHLDVSVDKSVQKSDWLSWDLSALQIAYAKADVAHLPQLYEVLVRRLEAVGRADLAVQCFDHLPTRVALELGDFGDVFSY
jgi:ribonuclease D